MDLLHLKYFQTVAKYEHITKAAKELYISQPYLSSSINKLEEELGTPLFDRKGRNIVLNDSGKVFLEYVNTIFREMNNALLVLNKHVGKKTLAIGTTNTRFLSRFLGEYLARDPNMKVEVKVMDCETMKKELLSSSIDFGLASPALTDNEFESIILREDDFMLTVPNTHKFANQKTISIHEIANEPFIWQSQHDNYKDVIYSIFKKNNITLNIIYEGDGYLGKELVKEGKGIIFSLQSVVEGFVDADDFVNIKIEEFDFKFTRSLTWVRNNYLPTKLNEILKFTIDYYHRNKI
ncbi:MAG: LysR family transcriptional regulator [Dehalobacterium sp.]